MGLLEQLLVELGLGEEVGGAGLQVQHHVDPGLAGGIDPGAQLPGVDRPGVVAVAPGLRRGDRGDDLEGGDHRFGGELLVLGGELLDAGDGLLESLLAEDAEGGGAGGA
eukprot:Nk52_evm1s1830 gene=Nk52_evmTU1s1830